MAPNEKEGAQQEMVCPSCGYRARSADDMQAHLKITKDDAKHAVKMRATGETDDY
jgi:DNA-directed RNA polymerase subunit M/transcription elongation factor TFIIS